MPFFGPPSIYLFIIAPSTQFSRAEILNYRNYVQNGYDAGSEIANVSAKHVALKRWTVTDKRWKKNVVSRGSVVRRHLSQMLSDLCQELLGADTHRSKLVFPVPLEKKSWVLLSELYLFLFLTVAVSAALALVMTLCCR